MAIKNIISLKSKKNKVKVGCRWGELSSLIQRKIWLGPLKGTLHMYGYKEYHQLKEKKKLRFRLGHTWGAI